jgi:hypothetical protein
MFTFGANEAVRPIAMNYFKAAIGIGLQLLTLYIIMGVGVQIGQGWSVLIGQAAANHELKPFLVVGAAVVVFYLIAKNVPPFIAGLSGVGGFKNFGDEAIGAVVAAGGVGAMAMQKASSGATGGIQAMGQGIKGALQAGQYASQHQQSGMSGFQAAGKAAMGLAGSMGSAIKDSVMKNNTHMSYGQKVNAAMSQKLAEQAAKASKAAAPGSDFKSNQVNK